MLAPRWAFDPLSGAGAARAGRRWNEIGQKALYLSADHATAIAEYQQDLPRPGTLTAYDVRADSMIDLTDRDVLAALAFDLDLLRAPWKLARDIERRRPACWDFVTAAVAHGCQGARAPPVQAEGSNLLWWRWNEDEGATVHYVDPLGDLPQDQRSWRR
jgi:RES domain-containing protein